MKSGLRKAEGTPASRRRPLVRGEPVVRRTLKAAMRELERVGYGALRIENVAARAGVNKTTVYRRWSTKQALVRAALLSIAERHDVMHVPNTGSVRDDLIALVRRSIALKSSREGRTILRMLAAESPESDLSAIARSIQKAHEAIPRGILQRAKKRGELRANLEPSLLFELLRAACDGLILRSRNVNERFVVRVVDLLLMGAQSPRSRAAARAVRHQA